MDADHYIALAKRKAYGPGVCPNEHEGDFGTWSEWHDLIGTAIAQARQEGQESMRERAAFIADGWGDATSTVGKSVADDIRALPVE